MIYYTCKYVPTELFAGFGVSCMPLDDAPESFEQAETVVHPNICGFGKTIVQNVLLGNVDELVMVNCCDTTRRVYEVIKELGTCKFVYLLDLPHCNDACAQDRFAQSLADLMEAYGAYCGRTFDLDACKQAFHPAAINDQPYIGVMGTRANTQLMHMISDELPLPARNLTCLGLRDVSLSSEFDTEHGFLHAYAAALLEQVPCGRMADTSRRARILDDPHLRGIIYHTVRFCDYYSREYSDIAQQSATPSLRIESDFTRQGEEQLRTRIQAFAEGIAETNTKGAAMQLTENALVAGIDSGSASTDVIIMDRARRIVAASVIPTQGSASASAEASLQAALDEAGIPRNAIERTVSTGYGRDSIGIGDASITEITCHARGAHFLDPEVRTIIDIGGQDSKAISINEDGTVRTFAMNDKCAAGTGRFLDMMARTLGISLEQMSTAGMSSKHKVSISSTCTVFAESEVVSLVARNVALPDIVAALNRSVAAKTTSLVKRVGVSERVMMTGGVAKNEGVVDSIQEKLNVHLIVSDQAQLCGAIGAALFALED